MKAEGKVIVPIGEKPIIEERHQFYAEGEGLRRVEIRTVTSESDYVNGIWRRTSDNNGKTWSHWQDTYQNEYFHYDKDELIIIGRDAYAWNPVNRHYISVSMDRFFVDGHVAAYEALWTKLEAGTVIDHAYLSWKNKPGDEWTTQLVRYEDGDDFNPENPRNPRFLQRNRAFSASGFSIAPNGDVLFPIGPCVRKCCELGGTDVAREFPNCTDMAKGAMIARAKWNGAAYDITLSNPIIIPDLQSSRCIDEPTVLELTSGRVLVVMRGSNVQSEAWRTRIEKGTPGFKWYAWSDDGGMTFTRPMPWHFDNGEVVYSSASISKLVRSTKNGRAYWIGNFTRPQINGNAPRWPLVIAEVDECTGCAKKDTLTVIDTRREGESDRVQLSNFSFLEDRETGAFEVMLAKYDQFSESRGNPYFGETWHYTITLDE
ncbi:MAG: sialidase family protein [Clostridiaceae bacterium]|nr:sialidase family protein [Clostridiaceae bacterium]